MQKQLYVLGFMFNSTGSRVVLIQKQHGPEHLIGKLNGVGGKVELGEYTVCAMAREFVEETGAYLSPGLWQPFAQFEDAAHTYIVTCYRAFSDAACRAARTTTDEPVRAATVNQLPDYHPPLAPNLMWLLYLALSGNTAHAIER